MEFKSSLLSSLYLNNLEDNEFNERINYKDRRAIKRHPREIRIKTSKVSYMLSWYELTNKVI